MKKFLELYTYLDGVSDTPFPDASKDPIKVGEFVYDAKRMGSAPTINFTLMYGQCLDDVWTDNVYVEFRGERYFLDGTPTSSFSKDDARYKHEVKLVSERRVLDETYFFDTVIEEIPGYDRPVSNSTTVVFHGGIEEFKKRLNASLNYSKLDYEVVIDDSIVSSEEKLLSFTDKTFNSVLQEVYNTFNIPYYFVGKKIHIGSSDSRIGTEAEPLKYGSDAQLLSITKSNANFKIVNRITGTGSSDNIPHYYPNITPYGGEIICLLKNGDSESEQTSDAKVIDADLFSSTCGINSSFVFHEPEELSDVSHRWYLDNRNLSYGVSNGYQINYKYHNSLQYAIRRYTAQVWWDVNFLDEEYSSIIPINERITAKFRAATKMFTKSSDDSHPWPDCESVSLSDFRVKYVDQEEGDNDYLARSTDGYIEDFNLDLSKPLRFEADLIVDIEPSQLTGNRLGVTGYIEMAFSCSYGLTAHVSDNSVSGGWKLYREDGEGSSSRYDNLRSFGISVDFTPVDGDTISFESSEQKIPSSSKLLPTIYRETKGSERFYNAKDGFYEIPQTDGEQYDFENEYSDGNPKEHILDLPDIRPTIAGTKNSDNLSIDMFLEFAYDEDDNDEIDDENKYKHPYFYGKLRKFDGANGFNLFDHVVDGQTMHIEMTSGSCGACKWTIGVDEDTMKNTVQVQSNGSLKRDSNGNVIYSGVAQDVQNDTINNEVWIAIKKEESTFGVIMPNAEHNYKPKGCTDAQSEDGDTFVITGIHLPQSYIYNAEKKLEEELIKYMFENNSEKFTFSIQFSKIYLEENPGVADELSENSEVYLLYNGNVIRLFVSSYEYKAESPLPTISVELSDTIEIRRNAVQRIASTVKDDIITMIPDVKEIGKNLFLRKDIDDTVVSRPYFASGFEAKDAEIIKSISSRGYKSGGMDGSGWKVGVDSNGSSYIEVDEILARKKLNVSTLSVNQIDVQKGEIAVTKGGCIITSVEANDGYWRCYYDNKSGSSYSGFAVGDFARCMRYDESYNNIIREYWREVVGVDSSYVDLSVDSCSDGSSEPEVGDNIVQLGNASDVSRQSAIFISPDNGGSIKIFAGVNSFSLTDKNFVGMGVNPDTNRAYLYGYGDMFFGDRNLEKNFITFQIPDGGTEPEMFINANVTLGADSTGLENLSEFKEVSDKVDKVAEETSKEYTIWFFDAEPTLENEPAVNWSTDEDKEFHDQDLYFSDDLGRAWRWEKQDSEWGWYEITDAQTIVALQKATEVNSRLDSWANDGVMSEVEKKSFALQFESDKSDFERLKAEFNVAYPNSEFGYTLAYAFFTGYSSIAEEILASEGDFTDSTKINNLKSYRANYYVQKNSIVDGIATETDTSYLRDVFPNAVVENQGATLSKLLGVLDSDGNVVAGLYGGGNEDLNEVDGYNDANHGALMMFAGADSIDSPETAKFKVWGDGCISAQSGSFGGVLIKEPTIITQNNIEKYFTKVEVEGYSPYWEMKPHTVGSYMIFEDISDTVSIHPIPSGISDDAKRGYDGASFILANKSDASISVCYNLACISAVETGYCCHFTISITIDNSTSPARESGYQISVDKRYKMNGY